MDFITLVTAAPEAAAAAIAGTAPGNWAMLGVAAAGVMSATGAGVASDRDRLAPAPILLLSTAALVLSSACLTAVGWWCASALASSLDAAGGSSPWNGPLPLALAAAGAGIGVLAAVAGHGSARHRAQWEPRYHPSFGPDRVGLGILQSSFDACSTLAPGLAWSPLGPLALTLLLLALVVVLPGVLVALPLSFVAHALARRGEPATTIARPVVTGGVTMASDGTPLSPHEIIAANTSQPRPSLPPRGRVAFALLDAPHVGGVRLTR